MTGSGPAAPAGPPRAGVALGRLVAPLDQLFERVYGARWNPLHQSGNLAVLSLLVTVTTGVFLFLFYRIGDPHGSVAAIENEILLGSWVRSLHRYSADLALAATILHVLRKLIHGHTWGPRALAWVSGIFVVGAVLASGWTGLVLVWDVQAQEIAVQGARLFDLLPVFAEPISAMFSGAQPVPTSFFFMNLFLHVALPLGVGALVAVHVARVARPALLPPKALRRGVLAALAIVAAVAPVALPPAADLLALPGEMPTDLFFAFWLPVAQRVTPLAHLGIWLGAFALAVSAAWWWRPRRPIATSSVDEDRCSGCTACYQDCPYEAIAMVRRERASTQTSEFVARVDPELCVGCGICAASCAPMGVGPAGRTGRDQLAAARAIADAARPAGREIAIVACHHGAAEAKELLAGAGRRFLDGGCAGSLHTSVVELLLRRGFAGVFVVTCPPRDCSFREGPKWLAARIHDGREAELPPRVDRRRVAAAPFSIVGAGGIVHRLADFERELAALAIEIEAAPEITAECDREAAERVLAEVANG